MGVIRLLGMEFYGYHGVFAAEQELGQRFVVDLELHRDLKPAADSDDLEQALNYVDVYALVKQIVEERTYSLLETLADVIMTEVRSEFSVDGVVVRVRKPHVALGGLLEAVEIELEHWDEDVVDVDDV